MFLKDTLYIFFFYASRFTEHHDICSFDIFLKAVVKLELTIFKGKNNHRHPICH